MTPHTDLQEGDVFFLDLSQHTGISANTVKEPHFITVVMHPNKLANPNHKTIICVPMTSLKDKTNLWDYENNRPRLFFHHCIHPAKYPGLHYDTLVKCEQIFTINREYFTDYRFTLDNEDLHEVRRRMINIIGYRVPFSR